MRTKIEVKNKHIKAGKRGKCELCPIALAIKEKFPSAAVYVDFNIVELHFSNGVRLTSYLPQKASAFISRFDEGLKKVRPFSFCITPVE